MFKCSEQMGIWMSKIWMKRFGEVFHLNFKLYFCFHECLTYKFEDLAIVKYYNLFIFGLWFSMKGILLLLLVGVFTLKNLQIFLRLVVAK